MLGEQQEYEPLCRDCYKKATQEEANKNVLKKTYETNNYFR